MFCVTCTLKTNTFNKHINLEALWDVLHQCLGTKFIIWTSHGKGLMTVHTEPFRTTHYCVYVVMMRCSCRVWQGTRWRWCCQRSQVAVWFLGDTAELLWPVCTGVAAQTVVPRTLWAARTIRLLRRMCHQPRQRRRCFECRRAVAGTSSQCAEVLHSISAGWYSDIIFPWTEASSIYSVSQKKLYVFVSARTLSNFHQL